MRIHCFTEAYRGLLEVVVSEAYDENLASKINMDQAELRALVTEIDPSKKYSNFVLKNLKSYGIERAGEVKDFVQRFDRYRNNLKNKNIESYDLGSFDGDSENGDDDSEQELLDRYKAAVVKWGEVNDFDDGDEEYSTNVFEGEEFVDALGLDVNEALHLQLAVWCLENFVYEGLNEDDEVRLGEIDKLLRTFLKNRSKFRSSNILDFKLETLEKVILDKKPIHPIKRPDMVPVATFRESASVSYYAYAVLSTDAAEEFASYSWCIKNIGDSALVDGFFIYIFKNNRITACASYEGDSWGDTMNSGNGYEGRPKIHKFVESFKGMIESNYDDFMKQRRHFTNLAKLAEKASRSRKYTEPEDPL